MKIKTKAKDGLQKVSVIAVKGNDGNYAIAHLPRTFMNKRVWVLTQECYEDLRGKRST